MKTTIVRELLTKAENCLNSDYVEALQEVYGTARAQAIQQSNAETSVTVEPLRFTSTRIKFEVAAE